MKNFTILFIIILFLLMDISVEAQLRRNTSGGREMVRNPGNPNRKNPERKRQPEKPKGTNNPSRPINSNPHKYKNPQLVEKPVPDIKEVYVPVPVEVNYDYTNVEIFIDNSTTINIYKEEETISEYPATEIEEYALMINKYNRRLISNPDDSVVYYLRGFAKIKTKDYYGAIEDYSTYLKFIPWDEEAYFYRGLAFLYYGDRREALMDFKIASELGYKKGDSVLNKYFN